MIFLWITVVVVVLAGAALIYPGELSFVSSSSNRWLYDRAADDYENKWRSPAYEDETFRRAIERHSLECLNGARSAGTTAHRVLDLGCGTGRGIRVASQVLPQSTRYVGIDFSPRMLEGLRGWLETEGQALASRVELVEQDLTDWADGAAEEQYGLVFLLEVGEFVPGFERVVRRIAEVTAPGGGIVLTRPASIWWLFFPGRRQSRTALRNLLESVGFEAPRFLPWRARYELLFSRRK